MDSNIKNRVQTFRFGENISLGNVDNLIPEIDKFLDSKKVEKIILDMNNVLFCDSYGITFLLQCLRKAKNSRKELVLYKLNTYLYNLLNNCGLLKNFSISNEYDEHEQRTV